MVPYNGMQKGGGGLEHFSVLGKSYVRKVETQRAILQPVNLLAFLKWH